jgi:ABC-2 type transport system permease protein
VWASAQEQLAHRANFWISLLHSLLNLGTGVAGVSVLFGQIESVNGWTSSSALVLLGVYLLLSALRRLFIGPSLDALAGLDLALALGVIVIGAGRLEAAPHWPQLSAFAVALGAGVAILYAVLLAFTGLFFWSPALLYTWVFNAVFQMARYPVGLYPGWLRLVLTWVVPVGVMTTVPAQALTGRLPRGTLVGSVCLALAFLAGATALFRSGLRRYASASS